MPEIPDFASDFARSLAKEENNRKNSPPFPDIMRYMPRHLIDRNALDTYVAHKAAETAALLSDPTGPRAIRDLYSLHPGFRPTPFTSLDGLAAELGVGGLWVKDERNRWGLGSFKALGGTYAVLTVVAERLSAEIGRTVTPRDILLGRAPSAAHLTVTTATAGNHGRAVAFGAQLAGARAVIFVYDGVPAAQIATIADHGAEIVKIAGRSYDIAFHASVARSEKEGWALISDVAREGYEAIPMRIMQGYAVAAAEVLEQAPAAPTHIFVQAGVGGLAAPFVAYCSTHFRPAPKYIVVEADNVACLMESARAGQSVSVDEGRRSIMGRLDAGIPGSVTWPLLAQLADGFVAVDDDAALAAAALLGKYDMPTSPTGAAGLAGLCYALSNAQTRAALELNSASRVLIVATEKLTNDI